MELAAFQRYSPGHDRYADDNPVLKLDDLPERFDGDPKLSYMVSTWNRHAQLSRSLESLCRQEFREFEVLVNDDGSTQDIKGVVNKFSDFLNIRYFFTPRPHWVGCPSKAFKKMLPECKGEVIAIGHPEMMFSKEATKYLYYGTDLKCGLPGVYSNLNTYDYKKSDVSGKSLIWVTLKPLYVDEVKYDQMNAIDWHSDVDNLRNIPDFMGCLGLSHKGNTYWYVHSRHPWWFVGSAKRECPLWDDMPSFDGHASIDMWMMHYRGTNGIVDFTPEKFLCYHQAHQTSAVAPKSDHNRRDNL